MAKRVVKKLVGRGTGRPLGAAGGPRQGVIDRRSGQPVFWRRIEGDERSRQIGPVVKRVINAPNSVRFIFPKEGHAGLLNRPGDLRMVNTYLAKSGLTARKVGGSFVAEYQLFRVGKRKPLTGSELDSILPAGKNIRLS